MLAFACASTPTMPLVSFSSPTPTEYAAPEISRESSHAQTAKRRAVENNRAKKSVITKRCVLTLFLTDQLLSIVMVGRHREAAEPRLPASDKFLEQLNAP